MKKTGIFVPCISCKKLIFRRPSELKKSNNRPCCSMKCQHDVLKKKIKVYCSNCKKELYKLPSSIGKNTYCSKQCYKVNYKAENTPNWKGGRLIRKTGYVVVYHPNHPHNVGVNYVYEHRLIMEKKLGRYLNKNEDVHHKDGNRSNNNINNLELMSEYEHQKMHGDKRRNKITGRFD